MALVAGIDENAHEGCPGQRLDVGDDALQGMAVIGPSRQGLGMEGELAAL